MYKYILLFITVFTITSSYSQSGMTINGSTSDDSFKEVVLYEVINGRVEPIAKSKIIENRFGFKFFPNYDGFYAIGRPENEHFTYYDIIYGKDNEVLNITLNKNSYRLYGKNSKENKDLFTLQNLLVNMKIANRIGSRESFEEFFSKIVKTNPYIVTFKATSKDAAFLEKFNILKDHMFTLYAVNFKYTPKTKHPTKEQLIPYYASVNQSAYLNENLLILPFGDNLMNTLITDAGLLNKFKLTRDTNRIQNIINYIPSDVIKGQYITSLSKSFKSYDEYMKMVEPNKQFITLKDQQERLTKKLTELADSKPGNDFIDFSFLDFKGNTYTKKSFANKVLVLDFWATWCGPCKAEEPYFEDLAKEYQGKEVVFVGISTDKDKKAWEKYVEPKQDHFKGIHLHAGPNNLLSTAYQVNSIPRYMVIDKNGKIISVNSARPSNPELKKLIDTLL